MASQGKVPHIRRAQPMDSNPGLMVGTEFKVPGPHSVKGRGSVTDGKSAKHAPRYPLTVPCRYQKAQTSLCHWIICLQLDAASANLDIGGAKWPECEV